MPLEKAAPMQPGALQDLENIKSSFPTIEQAIELRVAEVLQTKAKERVDAYNKEEEKARMAEKNIRTQLEAKLQKQEKGTFAHMQCKAD